MLVFIYFGLIKESLLQLQAAARRNRPQQLFPVILFVLSSTAPPTFDKKKK